MGPSVAFRWWLGGAGVQNGFTLTSGASCRLGASPRGPSHRVAARLTRTLRTPALSAPRQEEAPSLKAWARTSPSVASAIVYWPSDRRACDRRSDREFGVIVNLPKVEIKILSPRAVRIKQDKCMQRQFYREANETWTAGLLNCMVSSKSQHLILHSSFFPSFPLLKETAKSYKN